MDRGESQPILYFDGVCGLCNGFVDFLIARDRNRVLRFATLQGPTAQKNLPKNLTQDLTTFVLHDSRGTFLYSTAVLQAVAKLGGLWKLVSILLVFPRGLRDWVYRWIAKNRYAWFGKRQACRIPTEEERARFLD